MNKKGVALLLALFTLLIVSLLVVAFYELITIDLQITSNHLKRNQALYIADAGVEYAISRLRLNRSNFSQGVEFPSGSGNNYNVNVTSVDISAKIILSTGTLASGEAVRLEAKVSVLGQNPPYRLKIISWREL
jgi:type II secretory pathway component PulK